MPPNSPQRVFLWALFVFIFISILARYSSANPISVQSLSDSMSLQIEETIVFNSVQNLTHSFTYVNEAFFQPEYVLMANYATSAPDISTGALVSSPYWLTPADLAIMAPLRHITPYITSHQVSGNHRASSCYYLYGSNPYYIGDVYSYNRTLNADYSMVYKFDFLGNLPSNIYTTLPGASSPTPIRVQCHNLMRDQNRDHLSLALFQYLSLNPLLSVPITAQFYEPTETRPFGSPDLAASSINLIANLVPQTASITSQLTIPPDLTAVNATYDIDVTIRTAHLSVLHLNLPIVSQTDADLSAARLIMNMQGTKVNAVSLSYTSGTLLGVYSDTPTISNWHNEPVILLNKNYGQTLYVSWPLLVLSPNVDIQIKFSILTTTPYTDTVVSVSMVPLHLIYQYLQKDNRPYIRPKYLLSYASIDPVRYPIQLFPPSSTPPAVANALSVIPNRLDRLKLSMSAFSISDIPALPQIASSTGRLYAVQKVTFKWSGDIPTEITNISPGSTIRISTSLYYFNRTQSSMKMGNPAFYIPFPYTDFPFDQIDTSTLSFSLPDIFQGEKGTVFIWSLQTFDPNQAFSIILPIFTVDTTFRLVTKIELVASGSTNFPTWDTTPATLSMQGGIVYSQLSATIQYAPDTLTTIDAVNAANDNITDNIQDAVTTYRDFAVSVTLLISSSANPYLTNFVNIDNSFNAPPVFPAASWSMPIPQFLDLDIVIARGRCNAEIWYTDANQNKHDLSTFPAQPLSKYALDNNFWLYFYAWYSSGSAIAPIFTNTPITQEWVGVDVKATISCFFPNALTNPTAIAPSQMYFGIISPNFVPNSFSSFSTTLSDSSVIRYLATYTGALLDSTNTFSHCKLVFSGTITLTAQIEQQLVTMLYNAIWAIPTLSSILQDPELTTFSLDQFKQRYIIKITRFSSEGMITFAYETPRVTIDPTINGNTPFIGPYYPSDMITLVGFTAYKVNLNNINDFSNTAGFDLLSDYIDPVIAHLGTFFVARRISYAAFYSSLLNSLKQLQSPENPSSRSFIEWNRVFLPVPNLEYFLFNQYSYINDIYAYLSAWFTQKPQTYRLDNPCFTRDMGTCGSKARGINSRAVCWIQCPIVSTDMAIFRYPVSESQSCRDDSDCSRTMFYYHFFRTICDKTIRRCIEDPSMTNNPYFWDSTFFLSLYTRHQYSAYTFPNRGNMDATEAYTQYQNDITMNECPTSSFPFTGYACSSPPKSLSVQLTSTLSHPSYIQAQDTFRLTWNSDYPSNQLFTVDWVIKDSNGLISESKRIKSTLGTTISVSIPSPIRSISVNTEKGFVVSAEMTDPVYGDKFTLSTFTSLPSLQVLPTCSIVSTDGILKNLCQNNGSCDVNTGTCACVGGFSGHICQISPPVTPCSGGVCDLPSDTGASNCSNNNAFGSECDYEPVTITGGNPSQTTPSPTPPITVPPTQNITLPKTVLPLNEVCNIIIDIASKDEIEFDSTKHNEMCSVPTSGSLLVKTRKREIESGVYETDYICNCLCKGYWVDNPLTTDFKKCSKCSLSCPSNMTPNEECTACECVSSKCLSSLKLALPSSSSSSIDTTTTTPVPSYTPIQFFSAIYFDLAVLDIIQKPYQHDILTSTSLKQFITTQLQQPGVSLEDTPINQMNYAQQYYLQGSSTKVRNLYNTVMRDVANQIRKKMREDVILDNDENILDDSSFIFDVAIMPLVQSSYLVWKVVYFTTFDKRDYFKKPLDSTIISSMLLNAIKIANPSESQLPTPLPNDTIPTSDITHLAKLITIPLTFAYYDHIITRCATSSSIVSQSPTHPIEMNDLLKCPFATEYMIYKSFNPQTKNEVIDKELTAQRNPLWSKCTSIKYPIYEGLFNSEQIELYTREIYPYCFDFYGINIGGSNNYYIPCTYNLDMSASSSSSLSNNKLLYYSQHNDKILIPYYLQRMFQSIDLNGITNIQVNSTIARYKAQYLPEYPQFPQVTTVICDPKEYEIDTSSSPKPSIPITFPPTGMTSTPTVLSPSTHAHIGWSFSGNDQTTITLTAKPFNNTTSTSQNTTQFLWGQIIGEPRPSSSLHATAQLPSVSGSTLFGQIYSQLNGNNNNNNQQQHPLVTAYTTNGLVFTSFINQNATMMSTQDLSTTTSSLSTLQTTTTTTTTTTFNLPMLCDSLSIVCDDTTSQFCNQSTGTCECRDGYEVDTSSSSLKCISICQNSGVYNPITSLCDCTRPGTTGRYCEITDKCHVNHISFITDQIDPKSSSSSTLAQYDKSIADVYTAECNNGYYGYTTVFDEIKQQIQDICGGNNNDKKCTCFSPYWNTTESSLSLSSSQCSTCLLEPLSTDTMKTQIKNTGGIQRCYITGTNPITYANGQCTKCICKKGYSGEYCHIHTTYAQFKYQGYKNNKQQYLYDSVNEAILFDKFAHEVMLSLTRYDKDKISVYEHNLKHKYVIIAIQTDLDYFQRNLDEMSSSSSSSSLSPFQIQQSIISSLLSLSSLPSSTSDLYQQWLNMQNKFNSTPINNQESNEFLGGVQPPTDSQVYDPSCTEQGYTDCSKTTSFFPEDQHKTTSAVGMIVGIVIAAVCVIVLFIIVICVVKYAKKNKKWCYEEKKKKKNDNDSFKVQDNSYKGSTSAPSTLGSTISLMPMSATSGSVNTADSIKSVNNHTEVHDESLVGTDWKAYKDAKHQMFYVNQTTMESRWKHPIKDDMDEDDKGW